MRTDPLPYVRCWLENQGMSGDRPAPAAIENLLARATAEGVEGIVLHVLRRHASEDEALNKRILSQFHVGAVFQHFLADLARELSQRDAEVIVLKGATLASTVYKNQWSCRPMSDVDVLVRPQDRQTVQEAVDRIRAASDVSTPPIRVDLHTSLLNPERVPSRARLCTLSLAEIWALSRPLNGSIRHLTPELNFIYLALHGFKHSLSRLIWIVDLALVLRECDVGSLLSLARKVGAARPVAVALHILARLLGERPVNWRPTRLRAYERVCVRLACWRGVGHNLSWGEIFLALSVRGMIHKLRYLNEFLFPKSTVAGENRMLFATRRFWHFLTNKNRTKG